jgi:hypothetical protein
MPTHRKIQSGQSNTGFSARTLELEELSAERYIRAEIITAGNAAIGEIDKPFEWLDTACEARSAGMIYFAVEPAYEALRVDPSFAAMVRKVGPVTQMPSQETSEI